MGDDRIPPTGGSGTAPPYQRTRGIITMPNDPMTLLPDPLVAYLTAEVERLRRQLAAETEQNRRYAAAIAYYRGAACVGLGVLRAVPISDDVDLKAVNVGLGTMDGDITAGDDLIVPTAAEVARG